MRVTLLIVALLSALIIASACPAPKDNNKGFRASKDAKVFTTATPNITVKQGEEFILKLDSNPTTGYTWMLQDDETPAGLEFLGCRYTRTQAVGDRPLVGSGGVDSWAFRAVGKGAVHLNLQKVRPWVQPRPKEMDAGFTVNIE